LNRDSPGTDGRRKPAKQVRTIARDMTELLNEVKDRVPGGAAKQKAAAKKPLGRGSRTNATRSTSAKKAARARAKSCA
jgi:hypothetical protein